MTHHVPQFSSGAGSALAAKRIAESMGRDDRLTLLFADVGEHPDNYRFMREAHQWIGGDLVVITNGGRGPWDVFKEERFIGNTMVDLCSRKLKREPMAAWLAQNCDPIDTHIHLGFDWTEEHRFHRAQPRWAPWTVRAPLCEGEVLDKAEGMAMMAQQGIEPPLLTRRGYPHANCRGGCVKAGMGQWEKLLRDDPAEYAWWEREEAETAVIIGKKVTILRDRRGGTTKPMSLADFRERLGVAPLEDDERVFGACGCSTPDDPDEVLDLSVSVETFTVPGPHPLDLAPFEIPAEIASWYAMKESAGRGHRPAVI